MAVALALLGGAAQGDVQRRSLRAIAERRRAGLR
jgi:hypothetical protein